MRLVSVTLHGFKRFAERSKVDLDGPLVAIVGPNEAGKTSILEALLCLDDSEPVGPSERTRSAGVGNGQVVVDARYLVEPEDRQEIEALHGGDDPARSRWFQIQKLASGEIRIGLLPGLERDLGPRRAAAKLLGKLRKARLWPAAELEEGNVLLDESMNELAAALQGDDARLSPEMFQLLSDSASALRDLSRGGRLEELAVTFDELRKHEDETHPNEAAWHALARVRPEFLLFDETQRELRTEYDLAEVAGDPPPALANLARLAQLDLVELRDFLATRDSGAVKGLLEKANARLKEAFDAWSQAKVAASIDPGDATTIRIHVSNPAGGYSKLEERSDGLKAFIALLALTARDERQIPPIILIDEAELHLHYDGQADMIQVFSRQEALPQIIYTTHSAARKPFNSAGPFILGLRLRSIAYLNVCAVTGSFEGGEKRNPLRIVNVYVLPSADRAGSDWATSGTTREPAGPGLSG